MMPNRIYLSPPHLCGKELEYVTQAINSNWIAPVGPDLNAFEREICEYTGASHAVALSSGTAAIHLGLIVSGVKAGDEVLCSTFTFAGSVNPIVYLGATPVFVDSEETSWNMNPQLLAKAIHERKAKGRKPKACIVVHLYGQSADMDPIREICELHEIALIEDAAESLGATYKSNHTGTIAPLGIFSFNGNKIITSSGGGMLVGHDKNLIEKARFLSTQARDSAPHYEHSEIGYNYRMSNIVAAVGRGQLSAIKGRVSRRREIFDWYTRALSDIDGVSFMPEARYGRSNRWLTCITIDSRKTDCTPEDIRLALEDENIESRPVWKPMHVQPVFDHFPAYLSGVSENLFATGLCLPSGSSLEEKDLVRISDCIHHRIQR